MAKLVKLHNKVYDALAAEKKLGETFSEVVARLLTLLALFRQVERESGSEDTPPEAHQTSPEQD